MEITREILEYFVGWTKLKIRLHATKEEPVYFYEREIWWASLGANIGYEQDGKNNNYERPILILKKFNKHVFWALPLTSTIKDHKYYFPIEYNNEKYCIILSQFRLISSKRLRRNIRTISEKEFDQIRDKIKDLI